MAKQPTRRDVLVGGAAVLAASACAEKGEARMSKQERMPVVFLPHGGGPWPFVDIGWNLQDADALDAYLKSVKALPKTPPKALLVISAHWEERVPTVMTSSAPPMFYDYYGFPAASYQIKWPAPGNPALAKRVQELLGAAGFQSATDSERGFDHGTFVPLKLTYPDA